MHYCGLPALWLSLGIGVAATAGADEAADRIALNRAAQAWVEAFNRRDADAMAALATEDVVLLDPDLAPASGQGAALAAWRRAVAAARTQIAVADKETVVLGDIAWKIGAITHRSPDRLTVTDDALLEIWKRADGRWRIHRQMSSGILAPPRRLPRPPPEPVLDAPVN